MPFIDVNNRRRRPRLDQLISIMNAFKNKGDQEMEECDDYEPESPSEVPITVISTPASTSSSDPPVAPLPDILASPISCPTGNFSDLVKQKFGSDSVYCGENWVEVLQTCSRDLDMRQASKVLSIGKLNEDVSNSHIDMHFTILCCNSIIPLLQKMSFFSII